ncbi:hypothetical protein QAD02_008779 [Eretmocerus hayati]|uniref:Uncharacterized protein n=1 Tax=Eretmocerus hayati TaxID=131215 RepID=A0ACC2N7S0_9HYME|nr:hypothetical protein QAD02_008779 [Eretmocerus hayati]
MDICQRASSPQSFALRRRSSIYKPILEGGDIFKSSLREFIRVQSERKFEISDAPITWERLSRGYRITDFQIDRTEEALELFKKYYFCTKNACLAETLDIDIETIRKYQEYILDILSDWNSFCAIEEGSGRVVGVIIADCVIVQDESYEDVPYLLRLEKDLLDDADIFECYKGIDKFYCIHAICVEPDNYEKGIGTALVRACVLRAQKTGCQLCIGIFPDGAGQTIAQRFGFQVLTEQKVTNVPVTSVSNEKDSYYIDPDTLESRFVSCMCLHIPSEGCYDM